MTKKICPTQINIFLLFFPLFFNLCLFFLFIQTSSGFFPCGARDPSDPLWHNITLSLSRPSLLPHSYIFPYKARDLPLSKYHSPPWLPFILESLFSPVSNFLSLSHTNSKWGPPFLLTHADYLHLLSTNQNFKWKSHHNHSKLHN
jgi:hypothetical protein